MILEINTKQMGLKEDVIHEAKQLIHSALSRFEGVVSRVKVRLVDVNGPKGGVDKHCRISTKFKTTGQIIVAGQGYNYVEALNRSLDKLVRSIRREVEKRRKSRFHLKRRIEVVDSE